MKNRGLFIYIIYLGFSNYYKESSQIACNINYIYLNQLIILNFFVRAMEPEQAEQAENALSRAMERVSYLQLRLRDSNWAELSRLGFLKEASDCLDRLTGLRKTLEELQHYVKESKELEFESLLREYKKLENTLEKNIELEEKKESKLKEVHFQLKEEHPELFASLQQNVLSLLLKTRFLIERTSLFLKKKAPSPAVMEQAVERKELMELLEQKERELQELREKYENIRKRTVLGFAHEENAAELEREMHKLSLNFAKERKHFEGLLSSFRSTVSSMQAEFMQLSDKMEEIERIYSDFSDKASELIMLLKKERDFAKKTVLDIENEVLELRNTYSHELLKLEESKAAAKSEAVEETRKIIEKMQAELEDKEEMLRHFKEIAQRKEKESRELEEKLAYLNAAMKAREMDKRKTKKAKKRSKKKK